MDMNENNSSEREYYRTDVHLLVRYGTENEGSRQAMAMDQQMWAMQSKLEQAAGEVWENKGLSESVLPLLDLIRWMDFKIDMILYHLRTREHDLHFPGTLDVINISGSGLGVCGKSDLTPGQRIILAINLPNSPWRPMYAIGEVVRIKQPDDGDANDIGINFVEIADADRERIIRFTFEQQRRQLALRNQEMES